MRICLFTDTYFPTSCKRSANIQTLYDSLVSQGHRVLIVVPDFETRILFVEDDIMRCPAVKRHSFSPKGCKLLNEKERFRQIKEFNPDILHAHDFSALGMFAAKTSRRFDLPLMFTFHNPSESLPDTPNDLQDGQKSPSFFRHVSDRVSSILRLKDMRTMLYLADLITSPSGKAQQHLSTLQIDRKVEYFPASVNSEMFHPDSSTEDEKWSLRNRLGITETEKLVLFAGVLSADKNLTAILKFWAKRLKEETDIRLVIAGTGSEQQSLEDSARKLGISDHVIFTGSLSHDEMATLYSLSTLYLSALVSETIPLSMLEAMSAGLPVVLKFDPDNQSHIIERRNGFFFRSGREMCDLIRKFASLNREEMATVKAAVIKSVESFGSEKKIDALLDAYNRTISRHYNGHE